MLCAAAAWAACWPVVGAVETVSLRAERVALFKNGYSQVSLAGKLPEGKRMELKGLPLPVEGSLWWNVAQGVKVLQVEGSISEREVPAAEYTADALLTANIGKRVRIVMREGKEYAGELVRQQLPPSAALTYTNHSDSAHQQQLSQQAPVFLKSPEGEYWEVDIGSAVSIAFEEPPNTPSRTELQPLLTMELAQPAPGTDLRVECLAGGLSWSSTYRLDLREDAKADLECKAIIVNDMVDLDHTHLELVTGQPDLGGDGLPDSPLARLNDMQAKAASARTLMRNKMKPAGPTLYCCEIDEADDESEEGEVTRTGELYHYAIPDFSAKKGCAVAREIFTQSLTCRHIYTCYIGASESGDLDVWHCLNLKNQAAYPWSPGTVVCYSGGRLLARAALKPTAPGQETRLRLATTLEVKAHLRENLLAMHRGTNESDEDNNEEDPFADNSSQKKALSTYEGEIALKNNADHAVELEIIKRLRGQVTRADDGAQISATPVSKGNPNSRILWKIQLAPGESKTVRYTYKSI